MSYLFSADYKFRTWRTLWIALAEAEKELGLSITDSQIAELKATANDINYADAERREREIRHDVMSHIYAFGLQAPSAKGIIHLGATSAFVTDNTDILQMREALGIIRRRIVNLMAKLRDFAWQWRATVGGLATASLLVAVLVGPKAVHVTDNTYSEVEPASFYRQTDRAETQQELARLNTLRRNAAPSSTQWVGAVMRPASASRWHPDEDEGGASNSTPTEAPRSQSAGIRPI